jgi:hypothetical protein
MEDRKTKSTPKKAKAKAQPAKPAKPAKPARPATPVEIAHAAGPRISPEERHRLIAEAAYYRARKRGLEAGTEVEDWLAAEAEIDNELLRP